MNKDEFLAARKALGATQDEMGAILSVSATQVRRFEAGSNIPDRAASVTRFLAFGEWPENWPTSSKPKAEHSMTDIDVAVGRTLLRISQELLDELAPEMKGVDDDEWG